MTAAAEIEKDKILKAVYWLKRLLFPGGSTITVHRYEPFLE